MAPKLKVPILVTPCVVLPGCTSQLDIESSEERALILDLFEKKAVHHHDWPVFVGFIPMRASSTKPNPGDIGTYAKILSFSKNSSNQFLITVFGDQRMIIEKVALQNQHFEATVRIHEDPQEPLEKRASALPMTGLMSSPAFKSLAHWTQERYKFAIEIIADQMEFSTQEKLEILESLSFSERLGKFCSILESKLKRGSGEIGKVVYFGSGFKPMNRNAVVSFISRDFGNGSQPATRTPRALRVFQHPTEVRDQDAHGKLLDKIKEAKLPPEVLKVAMDEMSRLSATPSFGQEYSMLRNYIDTLISLPWSVSSQDHMCIKKAKEELERDHYAMEKVKRRVLEYLAVKQLKKTELRGPILCFVGPPGVGKTSIGRSIASILGRKFHRIGLGGVSDAAEIRGHRRTYMGAMPGRIIKALQYCGTNNPVILLDEIDKMSSGVIHGNPLASLLEVLDPEQNSQFTDHYLGVPFNLSQVIFIGTANCIDNVSSALRDRIEIIRVNGYTEDEKFHIAQDFIIPKALVEHGLDGEQIIIPDETLRFVTYTKEAGVRTLERKIGALLRDAALKIASIIDDHEAILPLMIDEETVKAVLGAAFYQKSSERHWTEGTVPGIVVGLSYTGMGGDILPIEATKIDLGSGKLILTGKLGKVLSESAKIAFNWFKNASAKYQMLEDTRRVDVHIHLPSGAVGKEGPSAGIALATALVSLFSSTPVIPQLALTGEITLQGHVLPVGGLKEKLAAAQRAGITKVILPKRSEYTLEDVPQNLLDSLELVLVDNMTEVIEYAFNGAINENRLLWSKM